MSAATILALLAAVVGLVAAALWFWASNTGSDFRGTEPGTPESRMGYLFLGTWRGMEKAAGRNRIAAVVTAASALIALCSAIASWHGICSN
jgi:hypothetical protein